MKPIALLLALISPLGAALRINEVHVNPPGADVVGGVSYEYIEIRSTTGGVESLAGHKLMLLDTDGGNMGRVDGYWDLSAFSTGSNGLLLLGLNLASTGGGPWAGRIAPGTALGDIPLAPGKDGLIEPNRAWSLLLLRNYTANITIGVSDVSTNDTALNVGVRSASVLQDAVGLNEHRFNTEDKTPPTPIANLSQTTYSAGNVSRLVGNTTANSAAAWFGGEVIGTSSTSTAFSTVRRFGTNPFPAATPGAPNDPQPPPDIRINEVSVNPPGSDGNFEYIELLKTGGTATTGTGYHLLVVNTDGSSDPTCATDRSRGVIVEAWSLDQVQFGANNLALLGQNYDEGYSPWRNHADPATVLSDVGVSTDPEAVKLGSSDIGNEIRVKENGVCALDRTNDGFSLLLVKGFTGAPLQDLDTNDDGVLDVQPWTELTDSVGYSSAFPTYARADLAQAGYLPDNLSRKAGNTTANSAAAFYGGRYPGHSPYQIAFGTDFFGGFRGQATPGRANLSAEAPVAGFAISELNFAPPGDAAQFIELKSTGTPVAATRGNSLVVVSTESGRSGEVLRSYDLTGYSTGANGLLLLGDSFATQAATLFPGITLRQETAVESGPAGFTAGDLPDRDFAVLVVRNFSGAADLDTDNDGVIDAAHDVSDGVAFGPLAHAAVSGFDAVPAFGNVSRTPAGAWYGGAIAGTAAGGLEFSEGFGPFLGSATPGQPNHSARAADTPALLNELNINPPGEDGVFDYLEVIDPAISARSLNGLSLVMIDGYPGSDGTGNVGEVTRVWHLDSIGTGRNGLTLMGSGYPAGGPFEAVRSPLTAVADPGMGLDALSSNDGFALLLVRGFSGRLGQDLDENNDGVLDSTPWTSVVDSVAFGARTYGFPNLTQAGYTPDHLSRGGRPADLVANDAARWYGGDLAGPASTDIAFDPAETFDNTGAVPIGTATPGRLNLGGILDDGVDNDGDGIVNLIERALGTNPDSAASGTRPAASLLDIAGQPHLALDFTRAKGGTGTAWDYTANGIRYVVQVSEDLENWTPAAPGIVSVGVTDLGASERVVVRLTDAVTSAAGKRFLRLSVTRP